MALGIYKPGQGYWVRVMTAALVGITTIAAAQYVAAQALLIADKLPKNTWRLGLAQFPPGAFSQGSTVELVVPGKDGGAEAVIGTALVETADGNNRVVAVNGIQMQGTREVTEARTIRSAAGTGAVAARADVTSKDPRPMVEPILLQGALASIVLLVGASIGYYFAGVRPQTVEFLIATDFEMQKVNWSTPKEIIGSTWVVVGACFLTALSLFLIDMAFRGFFTYIGVLGR